MFEKTKINKKMPGCPFFKKCSVEQWALRSSKPEVHSSHPVLPTFCTCNQRQIDSWVRYVRFFKIKLIFKGFYLPLNCENEPNYWILTKFVHKLTNEWAVVVAQLAEWLLQQQRATVWFKSSANIFTINCTEKTKMANI